MNPIFLVVGPPAVGKSTTSRALAAHFPRSIHIPVDDLRHMVVSNLMLPGPIWHDHLAQQIMLARESALAVALTYHRAGFAVVIDDFVDPNQLAEYHVLRGHPHTHRIILYPSQHTAHQRNVQRSGASPARDYIDEGIRSVYHHLDVVVGQLAQDGWMVVDTTTLDVEATVLKVLHAAQQARGSLITAY